ncbi:MAG: hypothetical protein R3C18_16410 [Planctomycetaceae bacterium]
MTFPLYIIEHEHTKFNEALANEQQFPPMALRFPESSGYAG